MAISDRDVEKIIKRVREVVKAEIQPIRQELYGSEEGKTRGVIGRIEATEDDMERFKKINWMIIGALALLSAMGVGSIVWTFVLHPKG